MGTTGKRRDDTAPHAEHEHTGDDDHDETDDLCPPGFTPTPDEPVGTGLFDRPAGSD